MSVISGIGGRLPRIGLPALRTTNIIFLVILAGLAAAAYFVLTASPKTAAVTPTTSAVARGVVLSSVSASGTVQTPRDLAIDFQTSGHVTSVDVKPGQRVRKGEVLGRLDTTDDQSAVTQAEASLASAKANLLAAETGETAAGRRADAATLAQSRASVRQARTSLQNARAQLAADRRSTAQSVASAQSSMTIRQGEAQLRADQGNEHAAVVKLQTDTAKLTVNGTTYDSADQAVNAWTAVVAQDKQSEQSATQTNYDLQAKQTIDNQQLSDDQTSLSEATSKSDKEHYRSLVDSDQDRVNQDARKLQDQAKLLNQLQYQLSQDESELTTLQTLQTTLTQDQSSVTNYESKIVSDRNKIDSDTSSRTNAIKSALETRTSTLAKDAQSIVSAEQQVAAAKLSLKSTTASNRSKNEVSPATIAQDKASVVQAAASLDAAKRTLAKTVLRAPVAGTVSKVGGTVGESVSAGGTSTVSATSSSSSSSTASTSSTSSGSSSFVQLVNLGGLQVTASFSETDAAKIHLGQAGTVTVSALPNMELAAHVIAVDVSGTSSSGVVQYTVTLALDRSVSGLKPGMSADITVTTGERDNVLNVPNGAVTGSGSNATVKVLGKNNVQQTVNVVAGLKGDSATEIVSGLTAGKRVVTSSGAAISSSGSGSTGTTGRPGGGLGGGGFPGGGGGFPGG